MLRSIASNLFGEGFSDDVCEGVACCADGLGVCGEWFGCGGQAANATKIDKLYVFGDSYSDQGEGYLDADGPTAVVYFAQKLGIRIAPSNTEDPKYRSLNFAVSGAQTGSGLGNKTQGALIGYGMKNQVQDFVDQVRSSGIDFNPKTTLFFIAGGLNDSRLADGVTVANEEDRDSLAL